jgi:hypothetical protein
LKLASVPGKLKKGKVILLYLTNDFGSTKNMACVNDMNVPSISSDSFSLCFE